MSGVVDDRVATLGSPGNGREAGIYLALLRRSYDESTEADVNDNDNVRIAFSVAVGALLGGVGGYLMFTDRGRSTLRSLQPTIDELQREIAGLAQSLHGATGVALNGWKMFEELLNEAATGNSQPTITH